MRMRAYHKIKFINAALLVSFSFLYLEWGKTQAHFMYEIAAIIFTEKAASFNTFTHPILLSILAGIIFILISLFSKKTGRLLNLTGVCLLGSFVIFLLLIGVLSQNAKIILSTLPYLCCSILFFHFRRKSLQKSIPNVEQ
jgi:hypothetical protein